MVIVGTTALQGPSGPGILKAATALAEKLQQTDEDGEEWKVFNVLHKYASQVKSKVLIVYRLDGTFSRQRDPLTIVVDN